MRGKQRRERRNRMDTSDKALDRVTRKPRNLMGDSNLSEKQLKELDRAAEIWQAKQAAKSHVPAKEQKATE
jgi:hypothetical protein